MYMYMYMYIYNKIYVYKNSITVITTIKQLSQVPARTQGRNSSALQPTHLLFLCPRVRLERGLHGYGEAKET